jgi:uncharacterized membrane protein
MLAGVIFMGFGLLFVGQGLGIIQWPTRSFMILQTQWVYYGVATAAAGALFVILARRRS